MNAPLDVRVNVVVKEEAGYPPAEEGRDTSGTAGTIIISSPLIE